MSDLPEEIYAWNVDPDQGCWDLDSEYPINGCRTKYIRADTVPQWRDIESAPKDKAILIHHQEFGSCEAWFESKSGRWFILDGRNLKEYRYFYSDMVEDLPCLTYLMSNPLHWMPLPPPPTPK